MKGELWETAIQPRQGHEGSSPSAYSREIYNIPQPGVYSDLFIYLFLDLFVTSDTIDHDSVDLSEDLGWNRNVLE